VKTPIILLVLLLVAVMFVLFVLIPRLRMERRARVLLAQHPNAERKSVYVAFRCGWASGKRREMDAKIAEMKDAGWTFLRATEASPVRTLCSWGGGVTLQFIRAHSFDEIQTRHPG
jgi:hypothetical protein